MTDPFRLAVTGATGQMGRAVRSLAAEREEFTIACAMNRDPAPEQVANTSIEPAGDIESLLAAHDPDVLVDFTGPESSVAYATACASAAVPFVTGTTGFSDADLEALDGASTEIPLLRAANFSPGIEVLGEAIEQIVSTLPDYDVELTETHHNHKRDAPSGTATTLLDRIERARGEHSENSGSGTRVYGREGNQPRDPGEIGVHVRRAGDVRGEHELLLAGNDEVLTLTHRSESRAVFAGGALDAAAWIVGREPDSYAFAEVLA